MFARFVKYELSVIEDKVQMGCHSYQKEISSTSKFEKCRSRGVGVRHVLQKWWSKGLPLPLRRESGTSSSIGRGQEQEGRRRELT